MKKFYAVFVVIVLTVFAIWIIKDKETTIGEEFPDAIQVESVSEISVIRGSDDKEVVIIEDSIKENLLTTLLNAEVKKSDGSSEGDSEVYWITIKNGNERKFGIRVNDKLKVAPYEYNGSKKNLNDYLFLEDKVLREIESLF